MNPILREKQNRGVKNSCELCDMEIPSSEVVYVAANVNGEDVWWIMPKLLDLAKNPKQKNEPQRGSEATNPEKESGELNDPTDKSTNQRE